MQSEKEFLTWFDEYFSAVKDSRQQSKVDYPLIEILFLAIVVIAGGADSWETIEGFGKAYLEELRQYYSFKNETPSDDTIRRVFEIIDPENMNTILSSYFSRDLIDEHIAIDGKSLRSSGSNGARDLHFLNGSMQRVLALHVYGKTVDAKTNEITAIPEAIEVLDLKGSVVTIDAMGCQKNIARQIINKGGNYIFGLKENHVTLYHEVKQVFASNASQFFGIESAATSEKGQGRYEERQCRVVKDLSKIPDSTKWPGIASVIEMKRIVTNKDRISESTNYYINCV